MGCEYNLFLQTASRRLLCLHTVVQKQWYLEVAASSGYLLFSDIGDLCHLDNSVHIQFMYGFVYCIFYGRHKHKASQRTEQSCTPKATAQSCTHSEEFSLHTYLHGSYSHCSLSERLWMWMPLRSCLHHTFMDTSTEKSTDYSKRIFDACPSHYLPGCL